MGSGSIPDQLQNSRIGSGSVSKLFSTRLPTLYRKTLYILVHLPYQGLQYQLCSVRSTLLSNIHSKYYQCTFYVLTNKNEQSSKYIPSNNGFGSLCVKNKIFKHFIMRQALLSSKVTHKFCFADP